MRFEDLLSEKTKLSDTTPANSEELRSPSESVNEAFFTAAYLPREARAARNPEAAQTGSLVADKTTERTNGSDRPAEAPTSVNDAKGASKPAGDGATMAAVAKAGAGPSDQAATAKLSDEAGAKTAGSDKPVTPPNYEDLANKLGHPDYRTRESATKALKQGNHEAVPHVEKALSSEDPEVARRARDVANYMIRTMELPELLKSPGLLGSLPPYSLSDRRDQARQALVDYPKDDNYKMWVCALANEAQFLQNNPKFVEDRIKLCDTIVNNEKYHDYQRDSYKRYKDALSKLDELTPLLKIDAVACTTDPVERRRLALETIKSHPTVATAWEQQRLLEKAGMMNDPEFADAWVLNGGDPRCVAGKHKDWAAIEKLLEQRLANELKKSEGKDSNQVADALHVLGLANEKQGNMDKAIKYYADEIKVQTAANPDATNIRSNLVYLGNLQLNNKKLEDGIKTFERVLTIDQAANRSGDDRFYAADRLTEIHKKAGNLTKAVGLQEGVIAELKGCPADKWTTEIKGVDLMGKLSPRYRAVAELKEAQKDIAGAEQSFKSAIRVKTADENKEHPWVAEDLMALGNFYSRQNREVDAQTLYRRALIASDKNKFDFRKAANVMIESLSKTNPASTEIDDLRARLKEWER
jgi:tetratricopeptide (TPR) repeat protein